MSKSHDFPFGIMDVAELLHLRRRRPHSTGAYYDCPFCDDKRGKMSLCADKDVFRLSNSLKESSSISLVKVASTSFISPIIPLLAIAINLIKAGA